METARVYVAAGLFIFLALIATYWLSSYSYTMNKDTNSVRVWQAWEPTNTDPLAYDSFSHHIAFRSVLGGLVTQYKV